MEPRSTGMKLPMWAKVLMALVALVLLGLGIIYPLGVAERGRWERYAATLREAGEPLTFAEIEARRTVLADDQNSALVIEAALMEFPPDPVALPYVLVLGSRWPRNDLLENLHQYAIDDSREFLERHRPLLDALQPVMGMPTGRITLARAKNQIHTLVPNRRGFRIATELARLDAILRLVDGDAGGAVDGAVLQLHIAGNLHELPSLVGALVEMACRRLGMQTAEDILRAAEVSEGNLVRLSEALATGHHANPMRWSMWSERAALVEGFDLLASGEKNPGDLYWVDAPVPSHLPEWIIRKNQIRAVEMLTRLTDASEDLTALHKAAQRLDSEFFQLSQAYFLARMLMPSVSRVVFLRIEHDTILECTLAGIAAERFRLATGHWPASLDELAPVYLDQVPLDPFAEGKPLKIAVTDQGIVIYSIGEDKMDDGGDVVAEKSQRVGLDIGFRLLDPEHRRVVITDEPRPEDE